MSERAPVLVDVHCGCGGSLRIEYPLQHSYDQDLIELAKAWIAAHRDHHEPPAKPAAQKGSSRS